MRKPGKSLALFTDGALADAGPVETGFIEPGRVASGQALPADTAQLICESPAADFCREHLWLALRFYDLPLEALCHDQTRNQTDGHAFAVVSEEGGRSVVIACNQAANDCGIRAGMALSAAYALIPELKLVAQNKAQEQEALKRLAAWAKKYTPMVSLHSPESVLLEIRGSLALFGGLQALVQKLEQDIHELGLQHYYAIAPTPTAALWLCRHSSGHIAVDVAQLHSLLGELPVTCTGWSADTLARLRGMGIHRLRDCLRLPRDGFARRIGKQRLAELDRALGKAPDPRENYQAPERYVARREFLFALDKLDMIFNGLKQLISELTGFLCGRQSGIQKLRVCLYHQDAPASVVKLGLAAVCRDEQRLASLLHQKLERLELPEPVVAVTMESGLLYPLAGSDGDLFDDTAHHEVHWPELVEKLRARLGVRAVTGLCLVPEHRPEQAWKYAEPGTPSDAWKQRRRPLWVLSDPCRMPLRQGKPHWHGVLKRVHGPERIESGWWDGQDVARDYFIATNTQGLCLWIYRERAHHEWANDDQASNARNHHQEGDKQTHYAWYLHGIFA